MDDLQLYADQQSSSFPRVCSHKCSEHCLLQLLTLETWYYEARRDILIGVNVL